MRGQVTLIPKRSSIRTKTPRKEKINLGFKKESQVQAEEQMPSLQVSFAIELFVTRTTLQKKRWQELLYLTMLNFPGNRAERGWYLYNKRGENLGVLSHLLIPHPGGKVQKGRGGDPEINFACL